MGFITLKQMFNGSLTSSDSEFILKYQEVLGKNDVEAEALVEKHYRHWQPATLPRTVLINIDCIESVEQKMSESSIISAKHYHKLPTISEVILRNGKKYTVWNSAYEIEAMIHDGHH